MLEPFDGFTNKDIANVHIYYKTAIKMTLYSPFIVVFKLGDLPC